MYQEYRLKMASQSSSKPKDGYASSQAPQLSGKVALVTGASSGVGEAIAIMFAKRGASVTLAGRNEERLKAAMQKCVEASGGYQQRFQTFSGEVTNADDRKSMVDKAMSKFGRLDILVNNAGALKFPDHIEQTTEDSFDAIMAVNVKSVYFMTQAALPYLEKAKGNIINISSFSSALATVPATVYSVSKAAVDHMTRCLALDLAPRGIRVNCVNPSLVTSRILRDVGSDEKCFAVMNDLGLKEQKLQPLEDRQVTLEEVAEAVTFFASDNARFIAGQILVVDGGRSLNGPFVF